MNNQFNMFGNDQQMPFAMGGHNPYGPSFGHSPLYYLSNEDVLKQLQAFSSYASLPPAALALMAEVFKRANQSFNATFTPTEAVQGGSYLFTSVFMNGFMHHYFVDTTSVKEQIDSIIQDTWVREEESGLVKADSQGTSLIKPERITRLLELGDVFRVVQVDAYGNQIGKAKIQGFSDLYGSQQFNVESRHPSTFLPVGVIEVDATSLFHAQGRQYRLVEIVAPVAKEYRNKGKITVDQWHELGQYLDSGNRLEEYLESVDKEHFRNSNGPFITQIHLFPADKETPIKFAGGQGRDWNEGQIDRNLHPRLFVGPVNGPGSNGYSW
jgi:hypothetical protein